MKPDTKKEHEKRLGLEKLMKESSKNLEQATRKAQKILPRSTDVFVDYNEIKEEIDDESKKIIESISDFYLDQKIIEEVSYVKQRIKVDTITISSLLFQMKTAEHAIIKLLIEIDRGQVSSRNFEVLSHLQRSKMEIIKHLAQFITLTENGYKNFYEDYKLLQEAKGELHESVDEEDGLSYFGSKKLLKTLKKQKQELENQENQSETEDFEDDNEFDEDKSDNNTNQ